MEERSIALKHRKEQLNNNLVTVLQGIDLLRRETNGRRSKALKLGREQFYKNIATVPQEKDSMKRETKLKKEVKL